ncbi:hypothetical protein Tco_1184153 [Tanacetum coccineum]
MLKLKQLRRKMSRMENLYGIDKEYKPVLMRLSVKRKQSWLAHFRRIKISIRTPSPTPLRKTTQTEFGDEILLTLGDCDNPHFQAQFHLRYVMGVPDAFLTNEIHATDDYKDYETVFVGVVIPMNQPQPGKKRKQSLGETSSLLKSLKVTIKQKQVVEYGRDKESYADKFDASMINNDVDDSGDRIEPKSHEELSEVFDEDDDNKEEKKDGKKDDEMGSLENRTEKMQTPIPITLRSPRINLSSDKNIAQELMDTVSLSTATTSKDPHKKRRNSSKYIHLLGALRRMCRCQGYMIRDMDQKCVTTDEFWKAHGNVDQVLHEIVPQIAEKATNNLIESNLKRSVVDTVIQQRDAFQAEVLALISKEFDTHASMIIE